MKYNVLLVYASMTGNTEAMAKAITSGIPNDHIVLTSTDIYNFQSTSLEDFDGIIIGSYTYGDGDIPDELLDFYDELNNYDLTGKDIALFGSGDSDYDIFCGALDLLEERVNQQGGNLILSTLKVDLWPEEKELEACKQFGNSFASLVKKQGLPPFNLSYT